MPQKRKSQSYLPIILGISTFCMIFCMGVVFVSVLGSLSAQQPALASPLPLSTIIAQTFQASSAQTALAQSPTAVSTATLFLTLIPGAFTETPTFIPLPTTAIGVIDLPSSASCIPHTVPQTGIVVNVVDGDTIKVKLDQDSQTYTVRYIGMNTPENTTKIEYFGPEATAQNSELVSGKRVILYKDVSETDRYGRLLRFIIAEGKFVNYELVAQGYATVDTFPPDIACADLFRAAQQTASASSLGLWTAHPTFLAIATPTLGGTALCACTGNLYNCSDFSSRAEAQACYDYCISIGAGDVHKLDGNNNGLACENLP